MLCCLAVIALALIGLALAATVLGCVAAACLEIGGVLLGFAIAAKMRRGHG